MNDYVIILRTCDKFLKYTEGLVWTIEKYWKNHPKAYFLSYKKPEFDLPKKWEFFSMGEDLGPKIWSNGFIDFFKEHHEIKHIFFFLDDMFILDDVDNKQMDYLYSIMLSDENIGKIQVGGSHADAKWNEPILKKQIYHEYDLAAIKQNVEYRLSSHPGFWRVDYFLKYMRYNQNPWEFELQHPKNDGVSLYTVRSNRPISMSHLFRQGKTTVGESWDKSWTDDKIMKPEDREYLGKKFNWI